MTEKKVIAFIVEGPSDEAALGTIMKEFFSSNEVQFVVIHGDITTEDYIFKRMWMLILSQSKQNLNNFGVHFPDSFLESQLQNILTCKELPVLL